MNIFESRMNELYAQIEHHAGLYYNDDAPEISDAEYDALVRELAELERDYPQFARKDFLTHKVGGSPSELFAKVNHEVPMLSLDNVFAPEELQNFFTRTKLEGPFTCEMKIDGLAVSLIYEDGIFMRGATRGDGNTGEDVTQNLMLIDAVPKRLNPAPSGRIEVRGEVLMSLERFNAINERFMENGEKPFANPRNAAAGTLRQKNSALLAERGLDIFLYYLVDAEAQGVTEQSEALMWLSEHGLPVQEAWQKCSNLGEVEEFISRWQNERYRLNYVTDGVVIKLDDITRWHEIGTTAHAPRWAVAYKYPPKEARTRLKDIKISVGRTGVLTPVAILEPVIVSGSTVQRATLHNADYIRDKDIRIGDTVYVSKAGDVIPHIDRVDFSARSGNEAPFVMPDKCPVCNAEVIRKSREILSKRSNGSPKVITEIAHVCTNKSCPAQLKERLRHFVSRKAMDIRGIGKILAYALVDSGKVKDITDIYRLTRDDWLAVCPGDKTADKIIKEVEDSKSRPLASFVTALGIPNVERTLAEKLSDYFETIEALETAPIEEIIKALSTKTEQAVLSVHEYFRHDENIETLRNELERYGAPTVKSLSASLRIIPGVNKAAAQKLAKYFRNIDAMTGITIDDIVKALTQDSEMIIVRSIHDFFMDSDSKKLIDNFKALGLNFSGSDRASLPGRPRHRPRQPAEIIEDRFRGKIFVFTGTLSSMTRNEAWAKVMELGGQCSENVSLKTSYVVAGDKAGSKLSKAQKLGITILTEQEFTEMLKKHPHNVKISI